MRNSTGIWVYKTIKRSSDKGSAQARVEIAKIPGRDVFTCTMRISGQFHDEQHKISLDTMQGWLDRHGITLPSGMLNEMQNYNAA